MTPFPAHPPARIGDFTIVRQLGQGGMGIVYLARQESVGRIVALKILGPALRLPADIVRFRREAQAAAKLTHPGIAAVHCAGQEEGVCYAAMEYVDGVTLRTAVERLSCATEGASTIDSVAASPDQALAVERIYVDAETGADAPLLSPRERELADGKAKLASTSLTAAARRRIATREHVRRCCELAREAALALDYAHEQGVIHRDIKPDNLMLDRAGRIHVIDFGLARILNDSTLTLTGQLVGTPCYMSPEQVSGRLAVDGRTDIYSLGLVLHELVTLRLPVQAATREALLRRIVTKSLPPVRWSNAAVPLELESIIHQATARDPDDRYARAAGLAADLTRFLDGKRVEARAYRYQLDAGEIIAQRPKWVTFVATWLCVLGGVFSLLIMFLLLQAALPPDMRAPGANVGVIWQFLYAAWFLGPIDFMVAFGLVQGRRWARWYSVLVMALLGAASSWLLFSLFREHSSDATPLAAGQRQTPGDTIFQLAVLIPTAGASLFCLACLLHPATSRWFRFATTIRREHQLQKAALQSSA